MARKRVVAYVRVSSASKAQIHSYEFQEQYWRGKFDGDPDNKLVHIYADRGISGSSAYKRPQFMQMLQDARNSQFDVIHTKSSPARQKHRRAATGGAASAGYGN